MIDDLRHLPDEMGAFRFCPQDIAGFLIAAMVFGVLIFGVLPDLHAWAQGLPPVGACK